MTPSPLPTLLFDFDGTLVNSGLLHDSAFRRVLQQHMPELLEQYCYDSVKGRSTREAFAALGVNKADALELLTQAKQQEYRDSLLRCRLNLLPGAQSLLDTLCARGSTMFLVTSGSMASVMPSLRSIGIENIFKGIITGDDVRACKPAPDPYEECLKRYSLNRHMCLAVEDALSGVISARRAGVPVIGVHDPKVAVWVDKFFSSLSDLRRWMDSTATRGAVS